MSERDRQFRQLYLSLRIRDQQRFYGDRAREYRSAHRQVVHVRNGLLLASAIAGVIAQTTHGTARAAWAVAAAVLSSLAGAATAYDALFGFSKLEKLYSDAAQNLDEAALDWTEPGANVGDELDRVEWIFRSERGGQVR